MDRSPATQLLCQPYQRFRKPSGPKADRKIFRVPKEGSGVPDNRMLGSLLPPRRHHQRK
jgi:hypothetical protein